MTNQKKILQILDSDRLEDKKTLFVFDKEDTEEHILFKFNLWSRYFFCKYFTSKDAQFHSEIDRYNLKCYREQFYFINIAFRGAAKTSRTKLFIAYCIANDLDHSRRYFKVLSQDGNNAKQIVTDIYNMFIQPEMVKMYPEIFAKTTKKREETMSSFTTATGVKILADTVGTNQRGALQEESRPDFIWFEDFEDRTTLRSAVKTKSIWDNMEEARTSLSVEGSAIYTCNYLSEAGNVHKLVTKKKSDNRHVLIVPIIEDDKIAWDRYSKADIEQMKLDDEDFEGERLCNPSLTKDIFFDRLVVDRQIVKNTIKEVASFKIFREFDPSHSYASGHDIAGGVGLDSSTSVFIDFSVVPAEVVATFESNTIKPDVFAYEIQRQVEMYGNCLCAPEQNNHGHTTIAILKQLGITMYETQKRNTRIMELKTNEYGWQTNALTKPKMLTELFKALKDNLLILNDCDIINEVKGFTRNDLIETIKDPRLTTRHFDLLIALAIAWQMKSFVTMADNKSLIKEFVNDSDYAVVN